MISEKMKASDIKTLNELLKNKSLNLPDDIEKARIIASRVCANDTDRQIRQVALKYVALEGTEKDAELLAKIAADESEELQFRLTSMASFKYMQDEVVRKNMIPVLQSKVDIVKCHAIELLGLTGNEETLKYLDKVDVNSASYLLKQLMLAKAIISHRHNLERDDLPVKEFIKRDSKNIKAPQKIVFSRLGQDQIVDITDRLDTHYSLSKSLNLAYGIKCMAQHPFTLLINNEWINNLNKEKPMKELAGLLIYTSEKDNETNAQSVIFSDSFKNETRLIICRKDGEILYCGNVERKSGKLQFEISEVERPAAAEVMIKGALTSEGIEFSETFASQHRRNARNPMKEEKSVI